MELKDKYDSTITVGELIEKLQTLPQDNKIFVSAYGRNDDCTTYVPIVHIWNNLQLIGLGEKRATVIDAEWNDLEDEDDGYEDEDV